MRLPSHKTKIVCTLGPACDQPPMLEQMIRAGMDVARVNFSHGDFEEHRQVIARLRAAEQAAGRSVAVLADLPGPKMRIGVLEPESITLKAGDTFTLTTEDLVGDATKASVSFALLPERVKPGDRLSLNDGLVLLEVAAVRPPEVECRVVVGGELRSRKGLNLPGIELGLSAFTEHDRACLKVALEAGVDAVSQSFVESAADLEAVRKAAATLGHQPFVIAKIERAAALRRLDEILDAADGIMIARGDLGVEMPIEQIALVQKRLVREANRRGKPVITATQMLESMVEHRLPTRAEVTDVANAILDGTDAVMLSAESAIGKYPLEAVTTLSRIAAAVEAHRAEHVQARVALEGERTERDSVAALMAQTVETALGRVPAAAVIVPTRSGTTARMISRLKPLVWIAAVSHDVRTCQGLRFSYGVEPVLLEAEPDDWTPFARQWVQSHGLSGEWAVLVAGPSEHNPLANHRVELIQLENAHSGASS